jgi:hypothetical protein
MGNFSKISKPFGVEATLILIAVLAVGMVSPTAWQPCKLVGGQPAISVPLSVNLPPMNLTLVALNGTQLKLNAVDIGNLPSYSGYGGFKNVLGNIKMWGYYTGVPLAVVCNLVGGMTANDSLTVIAADNYTITLTYAQFNGDFVAYNNVTGKQVPNNQSLTPILAYQYNDTNLTSDEGGPLRLAIVGPEGLVTDSTYWVKWVTQIEIMPASPTVTPLEGIIGITGYKLIFTETMNNSLSSPASIDYYWTFHADYWNGTQWIATAINDSTGSVLGYSIAALTTVDLPYSVYVLSPSTVKWGDWLRISFTFHWTYSGTSYSAGYVAKLHVHPGDIAGASVDFPYLGADGIVNVFDLGGITGNWYATLPPSANPLSAPAIADINGDGIVNILDLGCITSNWQATWTNTPPS